MNRERIAWLVSIVLLGLLAFQLPGGLARSDNDYAFVRTLVDIHHQVVRNYVDPIDESKLEQGAIDGMMGQLDPFSVYVPADKQEGFDRMLDGSFKGVGIQLDTTQDGKTEVVTPIEGSPAFKAGVLAGDIILAVNGDSIENLQLKDIITKISGKLGSEVTLKVRHVDGKEADLTMTRQEIVVPTVKGYEHKPDNSWDWYVSEDPKIGYLRITQFTEGTFDKVKSPVEDMLKENVKGLILDLRFDPGGRLEEAEKIVNLFVRDGTIVSTKGRNRPEYVRKAEPDQALPTFFPMIVLVNEHSASASEIVAGSLMDNKRAWVLGQRSYGKGSVQELIPMDDNAGELKLTVAYYYLPSGRLVHRKKDATDWGVDPQVPVPVDEAQEKAIFRELSDHEHYLRPVVPGTTQPATEAASLPVDVQLQAAVTLLARMHVSADLVAANQMPAPPPLPTTMATEPTTAPSDDD